MSQLTDFIPILVLVAAFYLLIIRPQQQRARKQRELIASLAPGDEVLTFGGVYGVVVSTGERVRIRVADGSELEVAPHALASVVSRAADEDEAGDDSTGEDAGSTS